MESNNICLEITQSFDLNNIISIEAEMLKENEIDLIIIYELNNAVWRNKKALPLMKMINCNYRSVLVVHFYFYYII